MDPQNTKNTRPQTGKNTRKSAPAEEQQAHPPKARKFVLTKVSHVRAEMGKLYSEARNKQIDVSDASKLANMLGILHRIIADSDLEARLQALESQLQEAKQ